MVRTDLETTRLAKELHALTETAKAINSPLELPELLDAVMRTIIGVLEQSDVGAIMLWDPPSGLFRPVAAVGYDLGVLKEIGLQAGESITGKVFDEGQACLLGNHPTKFWELCQICARKTGRSWRVRSAARSCQNQPLPRRFLWGRESLGCLSWKLSVTISSSPRKTCLLCKHWQTWWLWQLTATG